MHPKFKKHPYRLIAAVCLVIGSLFLSQYQLSILYNTRILEFQLKSIYFWSVMYHKGVNHAVWSIFFEDHWVRNNITLEQSYYVVYLDLITWKQIDFISLFTTLLLNCLLFLDIYLVLRNPFYPRYNRCKKYTLTSIVMVFIVMIVTMNNISMYGITINMYQHVDSPFYFMFLFFSCILTCASIVPFVLVQIRMKRTGTSAALRRKMYKNNTVFFILYMLLMLQISLDFFIPEVNSILYYPRNEQLGTFKNIVLTIEICIFNLIGIPLALIRLLEPYVFSIFKYEVRKFKYWLRSKICCSSRSIKPFKKKGKFSTDSLQTYVNSMMNVEYVYLILVGIRTFMENHRLEDLR